MAVSNREADEQLEREAEPPYAGHAGGPVGGSPAEKRAGAAKWITASPSIGPTEAARRSAVTRRRTSHNSSVLKKGTGTSRSREFCEEC